MLNRETGVSLTSITVETLSQQKADELIKSLSGAKPYEPLANFCEAFTQECQGGISNRSALPESRRLYYAVRVEGVRYLLVGITPNIDTESVGLSFARIYQESQRAASNCLRVFLQTELLPYCRWMTKSLIKARIVNAHSKKVFDHLTQHLPLGIDVLRFSDSSCVLHLAENSRKAS